MNLAPTSAAAQVAKHIIVCGDDFGLETHIDAALAELAQQRRLSAISCMASHPGLRERAHWLNDVPADLGLHLDFTDAALGLPRWPLGSLIRLTTLRRLDPAVIDDCLHRQFDTFESIFKRAPDYIDGHQHIHQFPQIRERVLALIDQRYPQARPWLRCTRAGDQAGLPWGERLKAWTIDALGARAFVDAAHRRGLKTNRRLLGVYRFNNERPRYQHLLPLWLRNAQDGDLLMCHPALAGSTDIWSRSRQWEYEVISSPLWTDTLARYGLSVVRLSQWAAAHR